MRRGVVTFQQLEALVPDYGDERRARPARQRMFERDKDELRAFGIPIETIEAREGDDPGYRLRAEDFYLPYLELAAEQGRSPSGRARASGPRRVDAYGYRALRSLAFEPDELAAVADAAARVRGLGDPSLTECAESAMRKLTFDLPLDERAEGDARLVAATARPDPAALDLLGQAVMARHRVTFAYHALERDTHERRVVEPWGMFYLSGHWYLAGCDRGRGEGDSGLRNFRVSRMRNVTFDPPVGAGAAPQYEVPVSFRLREHARSRPPWELGAGDAQLVSVAFAGDSGVTHAALALGDAAQPATDEERAAAAGAVVRRFRVRRPDAFVRWLLGFAGEARPLAPSAIVAAYQAEVAAIAARYAEAAR